MTVTNPGDVSLTNIVVTDAQCTTGPTYTGGDDGDNILQTTESWTYSCDVAGETADFTNTAEVDGDYSGTTYEDDDTADVTIETPAIGLAKRLVSADRVSAGTFDVVFDLLVENYGNVALSNLQVVDNLSATFPAPTTFTNVNISSTAFTVNGSYDGSSDTDLLAGTDTLAVGASGAIRIEVRVIPNKISFENIAFAYGEPPSGPPATDNSTDGDDPDPDNDGPGNNDDPTPVNFGANIFDPPFGFKSLDANGLPILEWTMIWINDNNFPSVAAVSDPIPVGTTYEVAGGVTCTTDSAVEAVPDAETTTTLCDYEAPTTTYPRGRIIWEGSLGPDLGATDQTDANDELYITFSVRVNDGVSQVQNIATIDADLNNNSNRTDPGEQTVASASASWQANNSSGGGSGGGSSNSSNSPGALPATGFAPGRVSAVSGSKAPENNPAATMELEIPALGVRIPIVGVPETAQGWNVDWLWEQAGWLQGTAFPTWTGNSVLTSHVYLPNGLPGPFVDLKTLRWGDEIIIHAYGFRYVYQVQAVRYVLPNNTSVLDHKDQSTLTLLTCAGYDEPKDSYRYRVAVETIRLFAEKE